MDIHNIYSNQPELMGLSIEAGWYIAKNCLFKNEISKLDTIFEAVNLIEGKTILFEYNDLDDIYTLTLVIIPRVEGKWDYSYDEKSVFKVIKESNLITDLYDDLFKILNKSLDRLLPIKIPTWWVVNKNYIIEDSLKYEAIEFIFSAYSKYKPWFIEAYFYKEDINPYKVFIGMNKTNINGIIYSFESTEQSFNLEFSNSNELIVFITNYMFTSDELLKGLYEK